MVSVIKRMRLLKQLLAIRLGPGAAILPKSVERVHLDFAVKIDDGHRGPRKFWRVMLPRLKYHNPAVQMAVTRSEDQKGPATLFIYMRNAGAAASSSNPTEAEAASSPPQRVLLPSETIPSDPNTVDMLLTPTRKNVPKPSHNQDVVAIDMKHKSEHTILQEFLKITGGQEVQPTQGELDTMRELEEFRERSKVDSTRSKAIREAWKREQAMLKQARGEMAEA